MIKSNRLFEKIDVNELSFEGISGELSRLEAGSFVYKKNQKADGLFMIIEGAVTVISSEKKIFLKEDDFFGSKILEQGVYQEAAVCEEDSLLLKLTAEEVEKLISQSEQIRDNILSFSVKKNEEKSRDQISEGEAKSEPCPEIEIPSDILKYEEVARKFYEVVYEPMKKALNLILEVEGNDPNEKLLEIEKEIRLVFEKSNVAKIYVEGVEKHERQILNARDLVNEFIEHFKIDFPFLNCSIEVEVEEDYKVNVDRKSFYEAAKQILLNACEATGNSGELKIKISRDAEYVEIQFADNGEGIKPEHALDVFEPFVSINKNGFGLGLTIADKIIREQEGKIAVKQTEVSGGVISIFLPVVDETE